MAERFDYTVERTKQLGEINLLVSTAKNMKFKNSIDGECRAIVGLARNIVLRQDQMDAVVIAENERLRGMIRVRLTGAMDDHEIDELMLESQGTTVDRATNSQLRKFLNERKKIEADQKAEQQKQADAEKANK